MITEAYFCPKCGSPGVDCSALIGGQASCRMCDWSGPTTDLTNHVFRQENGSEDQIARMFLTEIKNLVGSDFAVPMGKFLLKWGFLDQPVSAGDLARYLTSVARAVANAVLVERQELEKERISAGN